MIREELEAVIAEGKICDAGIQYVLRTDAGNKNKDIHRGKDGKLKNWSARAAQIASKKCKDPDYGTGKKKNESNMSEGEGGLKAWQEEEWVHSDGRPCGAGKKDGSQSRCKPKSKWKTMTKSEKAADNAKKKKGTKSGKQYVSATKKGKVTKSHTKRNENLREEFIPGGEASKYGQITVEEIIQAIAEEHGVSAEQIQQQFDMGVEEEMEHAQEEMIAQEIALDHLVEDPEYYSKLDQANLQEQKNCGCGQNPCKTYGKVNEEFKKHDMYDPKTGKKKVAKVEKDHHDLAKKGYAHVDPKDIEDILNAEGGAAGLDPFLDELGKDLEDEIIKALKGMPNVGKHKSGDYILDDDEEVDIVKEAEMEEAKKKKPCKPAKGKRFAKRVNGKCRSFGQAGKAKGGGDRIRPGTKKGDAYCARSAKIKKCKNPPCANDLSRKKWKCRGSKSMREEKGE